MAKREMIYVELLDEGVETWRPVLAVCEGKEIYRLPEEQDEDEKRAFPPGSRVRCEARELSGGIAQVACAVVE